MDLSKKIFGSNIDPEIQEYFKNLQKGTFDIQPGEPADVSYNRDTYLGDRTPYARMWTAVNVVSVQRDTSKPNSSKFKPIGNGTNSVYIVNDNSFNSYESSELDPIMQEYYGAPSELGNNPLLKPAAGVTEVTSRAEGSLGALRRTVVKFVVHNKEDFDKTFLPFFLKPGSHIFVDFGWSDKAFSLYDPNDFINNTDLEMGNFYDTIYNDDDKIKSGFTTTVSGQVTKYDVNVNQNQSFECTLEFVSANYQLLDKEVSEDNNLKFIFTNVLEDIIMVKYLSSSNRGADIVREELSQSYLWKEIPREERSKNIKEFFDLNKEFNADALLIDNYSKLVGVFYQNFSAKSTSNIQAKEALYISFAVFEDDFLNNYVSTTVKKDKEGNIISENVDKTSNMPKFNSKNTYIRWDQDLFDMMKIKPRSSDRLISFLYPDTWNVKETSNKYKPSHELYVNDSGKKDFPGNEKITQYDKLKRRIPLRELFISTTMIIEAFEASSNINDALERIFDNIFEDSGNLINIRVMKNNDFESSLTFHDVNIEPIEKKSDETFKFDITSGNTIVQNVDLKFETPKAGLSSMIAIGGLSAPNIFDDFQLMRFNILNAIQNDGFKKQIRHLPVFGDTIKTEKRIEVDLSKILDSNKNNYSRNAYLDDGDTKLDTRYSNYTKNRNKYLKSLDYENNSKESPPIVKLKDDDRTVFSANSERDISFIKAKVNSFIKSDANSISPVLPISLTLEIYGNNFLNIGDYFTINFLPEHFKDRVYFQIVGVDHNVSTSNWKTTYNTVMRPYSNKKYHQFGNSKNDDLSSYARVVPEGIFLDELLNGIQQSGNARNLHEKNMVGRFELTAGGFYKSPIPGFTKDVSYYSYLVQYDVNQNADKLSFDVITDTEEYNFADFNQPVPIVNKKKKSGNKFVLMSSSTPRYGVLEFAWLIAVSNLILGDEIIDWKKIKEEYGLEFFLTSVDDTPNKNDKNNLKNAIDGQIWVILTSPTITLIGIGITPFFNNMSNKFNKDDGGEQITITEIFTDLSKKQKISESINQRNVTPGGIENSYVFLERIDWSLLNVVYDQNSPVNEFKILKFDDDIAQSFPVIKLPTLFLKETNMKKIGNMIFTEYIKIKGELDEKLEEALIKPEKLSSNRVQTETFQSTPLQE